MKEGEMKFVDHVAIFGQGPVGMDRKMYEDIMAALKNVKIKMSVEVEPPPRKLLCMGTGAKSRVIPTADGLGTITILPFPSAGKSMWYSHVSRKIQRGGLEFKEPEKSDFDGSKLHRYLRDEAGVEKDFDLDEAWKSFKEHCTPDGIQFPGNLYDYKTQRRSGRVMVEEFRQEFLPQMFSKGRVAGESKPVKYNPRPSRFGFLDGLKTHRSR